MCCYLCKEALRTGGCTHGCQGLLTQVEAYRGIVLELLTTLAHDRYNASRGVAGYDKSDSLVLFIILTDGKPSGGAVSIMSGHELQLQRDL